MPVPPWFLRSLPGIGVAVTTVYVGYKIYEHVQQQQQQEQARAERECCAGGEEGKEEDETLSSLLLSDADRQERAQLCIWLGLVDDTALDRVPSHRLPVCLEALSLLPVSVRMAFLNVVFLDKLLLLEFDDEDNTDDDTDSSQIGQLIRLLQSLIQEEDGVVGINDDDGDDNNNDVVAREQAVVLLTQISAGNDISTFLQAMELCPVEQRCLLLNRLYHVVWKDLDRLDSVLTLWGMHRGDPTHMYPLVEAFATTASTAFNSSNATAGALLDVLLRLAVDDDKFQPHYYQHGFLRGLRLCEQHDGERAVQLLHKCHENYLSNERLQQVSLCFGRFSETQVLHLMATLLLRQPTTTTAVTSTSSSSSTTRE